MRVWLSQHLMVRVWLSQHLARIDDEPDYARVISFSICTAFTKGIHRSLRLLFLLHFLFLAVPALASPAKPRKNFKLYDVQCLFAVVY